MGKPWVPSNKSDTLNSTATEDKVKVLDLTETDSMTFKLLELVDGHDYFVTTRYSFENYGNHGVTHAGGCRRCNRSLDKKKDK